MLTQIGRRYRRHFKSLFVSKNVGYALKEVISEYPSIFLSKIALFICNDHNIDVSPPDSVGFCIRSLGVSADIARSAGSNLLVSAVNKHMRRIHGIYISI